jgi:molybdopterin synthase sulfur carrier subunit
MTSTRAVSVLYFGGAKESAGRAEEQLELPDAVRTIGDFAAFLEQKHPTLGGCLGAVRFAINETFVDTASVIAPGDVIAVIPPVSGG